MNIPEQKKTIRFTGTVVLVHIVFFLLALVYKRIYMGDSMEYIYEALNIKNYHFFYSGNPAMLIAPEYMTQRQPLYPLFLLAIYLFSVNNWVVLVLQNALSVFNIVYMRKMLTSIGYDTRYDKWLLLLVCTYPAQFINANTIAPDILLQTFTLLYVGLFIRWLQEKDLKYAIYMSMALIGGMLVKPVLYPFVFVHIVIVIVTAARLHLQMQRPVLVATVPLCAMLLYCYWNYTRTGKFHYSSNQAFNAVYYYYPYLSAKEGPDSAAHFLQHERQIIASIPEYKDQYDYANDRGSELLHQNFASYMAFHLKHSARILAEPGKAEIDLFTGKLTYGRLYSKEQTGFKATLQQKGISGLWPYISANPSLIVAAVIFIFNLVRLIGMLLFLTRRNMHILVRLLTGGLVAYFALAAGPIANTRYFLPVSLLCAGCAVIGFQLYTSRKAAS